MTTPRICHLSRITQYKTSVWFMGVLLIAQFTDDNSNKRNIPRVAIVMDRNRPIYSKYTQHPIWECKNVSKTNALAQIIFEISSPFSKIMLNTLTHFRVRTPVKIRNCLIWAAPLDTGRQKGEVSFPLASSATTYQYEYLIYGPGWNSDLIRLRALCMERSLVRSFQTAIVWLPDGQKQSSMDISNDVQSIVCRDYVYSYSHLIML